MKILLQRISLILGSALVVPMLAVAPVSAREATSGGSNSGTGSGSSSGTTTPTPVAPTAKVEDGPHLLQKAELTSRVDTLKKQAEVQVKELEATKTGTQKRSEQERQKSCEAHAADLSKRLTKKVADANKHKEVFDKIFSRIQEFHDSKSLTTPDYAALVTQATDAQMSAANAITTLQAFDTTIDCTQVDAAATKLASFKAALSQTRDSLKAYRTAIKNLIVAVKASVPAPTTTTPTNTTTGN